MKHDVTHVMSVDPLRRPDGWNFIRFGIGTFKSLILRSESGRKRQKFFCGSLISVAARPVRGREVRRRPTVAVSRTAFEPAANDGAIVRRK
jgi:hypothetical protein